MPANEVVDLQPDDLEVMQAEGDNGLAAVHVIVDEVRGAVRVQPLPRKAGGTRTRTGIPTTATLLLKADHRRASATIMSVGGAMLIAFSQASSQDPSMMAAWPANVPYMLTADTELWVAAQTGTIAVSIITESWATGR